MESMALSRPTRRHPLVGFVIAAVAACTLGACAGLAGLDGYAAGTCSDGCIEGGASEGGSREGEADAREDSAVDATSTSPPSPPVCNSGFVSCDGGCVSAATGCASILAPDACTAGACSAPDGGVTGFGYTPSHFTPSQYAPPSSATTIDCATTYDSSKHAFIGGCPGMTMPSVASNVAQTGGPSVDVLAFSALTIEAAGTLTLTGSNAVILAVYGDATVVGALHADGATGASKTATPGASGPGGNYACDTSAGTSQGDVHCSGGAGAGGSGPGGAGAGGVGGNAVAGGTARASASVVPLYGGCPGGTSGSWACQTGGGGGGGAIEIAVAGALLVSGTITARGGDGGTSTCFAAGCGANGYGGGGGGAGSGGAVWLEGQTVSTASGTIDVGGGTGGEPDTSGGGGTASGGMGGAGGTSASPAGGDGTGSTSNVCGSYTECGGGGGGGYGTLTITTH
jgi:hypothetical protein